MVHGIILVPSHDTIPSPGGDLERDGMDEFRIAIIIHRYIDIHWERARTASGLGKEQQSSTTTRRHVASFTTLLFNTLTKHFLHQ